VSDKKHQGVDNNRGNKERESKRKVAATVIKL